MWPDRVSNPGPLTYDSGALPTALRGPALHCLVDYLRKIPYFFDYVTVVLRFVRGDNT